MDRNWTWSLLVVSCLLSIWATDVDAASYQFVSVDVPFPDVDFTALYGINNSGVITGRLQDQVSDLLGFKRSGTGTFTAIPLLEPHGINTAGETACWYRTGDEFGLVLKGCLWTGRSLESFQPVPGFDTQTSDVNDFRDVVGCHAGADGRFHAFIRDGETGQFHTIDPMLESWSGFCANGINNAGTVVGGYAEFGYVQHGGAVATISVPGANFTIASDVNNNEAIVGTFCRPGQDCLGFWFANGRFVELAYPGACGTFAHGINDRGRIVGTWLECGTFRHHGFLAIRQP
jgi:hypothetical protein